MIWEIARCLSFLYVWWEIMCQYRCEKRGLTNVNRNIVHVRCWRFHLRREKKSCMDEGLVIVPYLSSCGWFIMIRCYPKVWEGGLEGRWACWDCIGKGDTAPPLIIHVIRQITCCNWNHFIFLPPSFSFHSPLFLNLLFFSSSLLTYHTNA